MSTPKIEDILSKKQSHQRFIYPVAKSDASGGIAALDENCDVISLESSEYDESTIADFSLFPQMSTHGSNLNHRSSHVMNTSLITKKLLTESGGLSYATSNQFGKPYLANSPPTSSHSIPKPPSSITSTPSRTTSSSQALQRIRSNSIKLPNSLVPTAKTKIPQSLIPINQITMTPAAPINKNKSVNSLSVSSRDCVIAPHDLLQGTKDSAASTVNTPQSQSQSKTTPLSQCSSVKSVHHTSKTHHDDFTDDDMVMFASLTDYVDVGASQLVEHLTDQDNSQLSAPSEAHLPSSNLSSSSVPLRCIRSITPSILCPPNGSHLSLDTGEMNSVVPGSELTTPSNLTITKNQDAPILSDRETPTESEVAIPLSAVQCSTPMSCDSTCRIPINFSSSSNSRSVSFLNHSTSSSPKGEAQCFDQELNQSRSELEGISSLGLAWTSDTRTSSVHNFSTSPFVTGIAIDGDGERSGVIEKVEEGIELAVMDVPIDVDHGAIRSSQENVDDVADKGMGINNSVQNEEDIAESVRECIENNLGWENGVEHSISKTDRFQEKDNMRGPTYFNYIVEVISGQEIPHTELETISTGVSQEEDINGTNFCVHLNPQSYANGTETSDHDLVFADKEELSNCVPDSRNGVEGAPGATVAIAPEVQEQSEDDGIKPPLHPQSKKRKRKSQTVTAVEQSQQPSARSSASSRPATRQSFPSAEPPARRSRQTSSSSYVNKRDAFLGSWPSRKQSAAGGDWRI